MCVRVFGFVCVCVYPYCLVIICDNLLLFATICLCESICAWMWVVFLCARVCMFVCVSVCVCLGRVCAFV